MLEEQAVPTEIIYGNVAEDSWESWRGFFPGEPPMAEIDRWHSREAQQRGHGIQMMLTMNHIRGNAQSVEIVDHWNCRCPNFSRHIAQHRAVSYRRVSAFKQG